MGWRLPWENVTHAKEFERETAAYRRLRPGSTWTPPSCSATDKTKSFRVSFLPWLSTKTILFHQVSKLTRGIDVLGPLSSGATYLDC